jgi:hypothetical protein
MRSKLIHEAHGQRSFVVVLDRGDEIKDCLGRFATAEQLSAAQVTAIGAFERAVLLFYVWDTKEYERIEVPEQTEVVSLNGDIALGEDGTPYLHLHALLGRRDGSTVGGHLDSGVVRPTLEIMVTESPAHLRRRHDAASGLALIRLD